MKKKFRKNRGFSLVELIIVIAIMAILAAAIAPALIRYIMKARKSDDRAAADSIGTALTAAYSENEDVYRYLHAQSNCIFTDGKEGQGVYRIVCYMQANQSTSGWENGSGLTNFNHTTPSGQYLDANGNVQSLSGNALTDFNNEVNDGIKETALILSETMGNKIFKLKFTSSHLNQWIVTIDQYDKLHIFIGGGMTSTCEYINSNHLLSGGSGHRVYEVWPNCDSQYNKLDQPPKSFVTN